MNKEIWSVNPYQGWMGAGLIPLELVPWSTNVEMVEVRYSATWRKNRKHESKKRILWMACLLTAWAPKFKLGRGSSGWETRFPKTDLVNYRLKNISRCLLRADWITTTAVQALVGADLLDTADWNVLCPFHSIASQSLREWADGGIIQVALPQDANSRAWATRGKEATNEACSNDDCANLLHRVTSTL